MFNVDNLQTDLVVKVQRVRNYDKSRQTPKLTVSAWIAWIRDLGLAVHILKQWNGEEIIRSDRKTARVLSSTPRSISYKAPSVKLSRSWVNTLAPACTWNMIDVQPFSDRPTSTSFWPATYNHRPAPTSRCTHHHKCKQEIWAQCSWDARQHQFNFVRRLSWFVSSNFSEKSL